MQAAENIESLFAPPSRVRGVRGVRGGQLFHARPIAFQGPGPAAKSGVG